MFQIGTDVRTVYTQRVVPVRAADVMCLCQRFTEVTADEILVTQLRTIGCAVPDVVWISTFPVEIATKTNAINVCTVVVEWNLFGLSAITFVAVTVLIPVDAAVQSQPSFLAFTLNGSVKFCGMFILVVSLPFW